MDKRWRNLIVLFVIIVVIASAFMYQDDLLEMVQPTLVEPEETNISLEEGYALITTTFESNGVDIKNVQELRLLGVNDSNNIVWLEDEEQLIKTRDELTVLYYSFDSVLSSEDTNELQLITNLFINTIDLAFYQKELADLQVELLASDVCQKLDKLEQFESLSKAIYLDLTVLAEEVDLFRYRYDMYSEPIVINLDNEFDSLGLINEYVRESKQGCGLIV